MVLTSYVIRIYIGLGHEEGGVIIDLTSQLCAEALCLEEMYGITIPIGYLYYGETKHRLEVPLTETLRSELVEMVREMHRLTEV